jgi:hypothetical protein
VSVRQMPREGICCIPLTSQERIAELLHCHCARDGALIAADVMWA